jgi:hypothetical protein
MYKFLKKPYTLAGFEPGISCSVGRRRQGKVMAHLVVTVSAETPLIAHLPRSEYNLVSYVYTYLCT